ncbi:MAG TPA: HEPN domain-containing protein [Patescibacteria group bacterium]|nr:HEPN domain-containing protein [Patescibacteria group bacterium]
MEKILEFWVNASKEDFETAKAMFRASRYNYTMFMCQQSLEDMLKAIILVKTKKRPPYIHDLVKLLEITKIKIPHDLLEKVEDINPHYIQARYHRARFDPKIYNKANAQKIISETEEILKWLTQKEKLTK